MAADATMIAADPGLDSALRLIPLAKGENEELGVGPALGYVREADLAFLREFLRSYAGQWVVVRFGTGRVVVSSPDFASLLDDERVHEGDALYFVPEDPDRFYSPDAQTQIMPPVVPLTKFVSSVETDWLLQAREGLEPGLYLCYNNGISNIVLPLQKDTVHIGRSLGADIRFEDPTISRRHAMLLANTEAVRVVEDRSASGVHVNGKRIQDHVLEDGDVISVGRYELHFLDLRVS